jgi:hypothetical protein
MIDPLVHLAERVADDPFFLASLLAVYAHGEELDDAGLAARLGCAPEQLPLVRLCRAPRRDPAGRREDVAAIAGHFGLDEGVLMEAVKRAGVLEQLRQAPPAGGGPLMAARDREEGPRQDPEAP